MRAHVRVVVGAPDGCVPARAGRAAFIGPPVGREAPLRAAHEAAALVRLVELERVDARADCPCQLSSCSSKRPTTANGCIISRRRRGRWCWRARRGAPARRTAGAAAAVPIAFAASTTTSAASGCSRAVAVDLLRAGQEARRRRSEPRTRRAGDQAGAERDRLRPVREVASTPSRPRGSPACRCPTARTGGGRRTAPRGSRWAPATSASRAGRARARPSCRRARAAAAAAAVGAGRVGRVAAEPGDADWRSRAVVVGPSSS